MPLLAPVDISDLKNLFQYSTSTLEIINYVANHNLCVSNSKWPKIISNQI